MQKMAVPEFMDEDEVEFWQEIVRVQGDVDEMAGARVRARGSQTVARANFSLEVAHACAPATRPSAAVCPVQTAHQNNA